MKNYESSNYLNELQNLKLYSKDNKFNNNDDISSIQLSDSNNDKDSRFLYDRRKEEKILKTKREGEVNN